MDPAALAIVQPSPAPVVFVDPTATPPAFSPPVGEMVRVSATEEIPLAQVQHLVSLGRNVQTVQAQAEALLERNQTAVSIASILDAFPMNAQSFMAQCLDYAADCVQKGLPLTSVDEAISTFTPEFDAPPDFQRTPTREMDNAVATVAEMFVSLKSYLDHQLKLRDNVDAGLHQQISSVLGSVQRQTVAQVASERLRIQVTPQLIQEWAKKGITDVLAAIDGGVLTPENVRGAPVAAVPGLEAQAPYVPPISAPRGGAESRIIPPDTIGPEAERMYRAGYRFADAAMNEGFERIFSR